MPAGGVLSSAPPLVNDSRSLPHLLFALARGKRARLPASHVLYVSPLKP